MKMLIIFIMQINAKLKNRNAEVVSLKLDGTSFYLDNGGSTVWLLLRTNLSIIY